MYLNGRISKILRHSYIFDWLIFLKDILEFDFATHPLQSVKISEKNTYAPQSYGRLIPRFSLPRHVFEWIKFLEY